MYKSKATVTLPVCVEMQSFLRTPECFQKLLKCLDYSSLRFGGKTYMILDFLKTSYYTQL